MLGSKGQAVVLTRRASGPYDPATGSSTITETTQGGRGVFLPLSPFRKSIGNIAEGDQQLLLSALTSAGAALSAPHVDDTVMDANSAVWSLISVDPLAPAGLDIIYDCVVRRAA